MATATTLGIEHVFVLMLENRSFDHMLGFSGIAGVTGLNGSESNQSGGRAFPVTRGADLRMPTDPGHEFGDVLLQLCGPGAVYPRGGPQGIKSVRIIRVRLAGFFVRPSSTAGTVNLRQRCVTSSVDS